MLTLLVHHHILQDLKNYNFYEINLNDKLRQKEGIMCHTNNDLIAEIYQDVNKGSLSYPHLYTGSNNWLNLVSQSDHYHLLYERFKKRIPDFLDYLEHVGELIGLGCGDSKKEYELSQALSRFNRLKSYCPVDVNYLNLQRTVCKFRNSDIDFRPLQIDMNNYIPLSNYSEKLFTILGNTLCNLDEQSFLADLSKKMAPRDYLLIEFQNPESQFSEEFEKEEILESRLIKKFLLAPFKYAGIKFKEEIKIKSYYKQGVINYHYYLPVIDSFKRKQRNVKIVEIHSPKVSVMKRILEQNNFSILYSSTIKDSTLILASKGGK